MPREVAPATTLKMRNRWLNFADEQEGFARQLEADRDKNGRYTWAEAIAKHRAAAAKYREAAAAYKPTIEGEA